MKVLNTIHEDYHVHSLNFSDGLNTIDEIARFAGEIGMKKIIITDHSQAELDVLHIAKKCQTATVRIRKNVFNDVEVSFGIEGDILNEAGDCCFDIDGVSRDFIILSCHEEVYEANHGDFSKMTEAYLNALERYHDKIKFIGHPCKKGTAEFIDIKKIVEAANKYHIPIEFNAGYFSRGETDLEKLNIMLSSADEIYITTDAHMLYQLTLKELAFDFLKEQGFIS